MLVFWLSGNNNDRLNRELSPSPYCVFIF